MTRGRETTGATLAAVGAAALWGTTGTAQALGPDGSDPVAVGALRIVVGALLLTLLATGGLGRPAPPSPRAGRLPALGVVLLGGLFVAAYQVCFFVGVDRAGVAVGTVVALGVAPLAAGLLGLLLGERPDGRWALATAGAVTGLVLLVAGAGGGTGGPDAPGVAAAVGAGVSYAGFTVAGRTLLVRGVRGIRVMAGFFTVGAVLLVPPLAMADLTWVLTGSGLAMVAWLGVVATGVSYVLFQHGLTHLSARTVGTLSLAEPVTATLLGVLLLHERLTGPSVLGVAVVVLSLVVMTLPARTRRRGSPGATGHPPVPTTDVDLH